FQAEDGIRDFHVTGVQTCALPISMFMGFMTSPESTAKFSAATGYMPVHTEADMSDVYAETPQFQTAVEQLSRARVQDFARVFVRSEERRVGKEGRSRWAPDECKKK